MDKRQGENQKLTGKLRRYTKTEQTFVVSVIRRWEGGSRCIVRHVVLVCLMKIRTETALFQDL